MLSIQYQAPVTGLADQTSSERSTAARSLIGRLNVTMIGMPTPTVSPGVRAVVALKPRSGRKTRNVPAATVRRPAGFTAVAVTW